MSMSFDNPIEGYFLITSDGLVFEVKGLVHPKDRIIAYLRYVPEFNQDESSLHYQKLYNLGDRNEYLKSQFPEYLWSSNVHRRIMQSVPRRKIVSILRPVECLARMKDSPRGLSKLQKATVVLAERLVHITGIAWSDIGITGSQLLGIETEKSDIDLVVYGSVACRKFYDGISENYDRVLGIRRYSGELLNTHVLFRWNELTQYHDILGRIETKKFLQGLFDEYEFFVRLVRRPEEVDEFYGRMLYEEIGCCEIRCTIKDDHDSIFTPCVYVVESSYYPSLRKLVSFRGRFTEQVSAGMTVRGKGRLEKVTDTTTGNSFHQLVMGEDPTDYLLPI